MLRAGHGIDPVETSWRARHGHADRNSSDWTNKRVAMAPGNRNPDEDHDLPAVRRIESTSESLHLPAETFWSLTVYDNQACHQ